MAANVQGLAFVAVFENRQPVTEAKFINKNSLFIQLPGVIRRLELKPISDPPRRMRIYSSPRHIAKPLVCVQVSCLCDESRSLDGRSRATFTIKLVVCCVALMGKVVNDATGVSVRAERIVKRL